MKLNILLGRSGSGKSAYIKKAITDNPQKAFLLMPDQYTQQTERSFEDTGWFFAEVLGFSQFSHRVFAAAGGSTLTMLDSDGRRMALELCIQSCKEQLTVYQKSGRALGEKMGEVITTLKLGGITPEQVLFCAQNAGGLLKHKLGDIAAIYAAYQEFMGKRFIDNGDSNSLLIDKIPQARFLFGANVYVDNVLRFEKQRLLLMKALLSVVGSLTITVQSADPNPDLSDFHQIAQEAGAGFCVITPPKELRRKSCGAAFFMERELFGKRTLHGCAPHEGAATLLEAQSVESEALGACAHIRTLLKSGAKQGDITIVAPETHTAALRRALTCCDIDYFMDEKRPFGSVSAVVFVLASIRAALNGFKTDDMLLLAKSQYIITGGDSDIFENFLIKTGIKRLPAVSFYDAEPEIESIRAALMERVAPLADALKSAGTAKECATALFNYMESCELRLQLERQCECLRETGLYDSAAEVSQAWAAVLHLLDQMVLLFDGPMKPSAFSRILNEGLCAHRTSIVPQLCDQVEVTNAANAALRNIKHLVLLGVCDGVFPQETVDSDIINDADAAKLTQLGVDAFLPGAAILRQARQEAYSLLSRATGSVFISCTHNHKLRPSNIWSKLVTMFGQPLRELLPDSNERRVQALIRAMSSLQNTGDPALRRDYAHYIKSQTKRLRMAERRLLNDESSIPAELIGAIYGADVTASCSRLESFNRCPFLHFAQYGLKAQKRREFKQTRLDSGSFYHEFFDKVFKYIIDNGIVWRELTQQDCDEIADGILDGLTETHNDGILRSDKRMEFVCLSLRRTAKRTLWAVVRQINAGEFVPMATEAEVNGFSTGLPLVEIGLSDGRSLRLRGKIDRVDVNERSKTYRIIDYKSGGQNFSYTELAAGTQLQLPIYSIAAKKFGELCGLFYQAVADPVTDAGAEDGNIYRLSGVLLQDQISSMDGSFEEESSVVNVSQKKDGSLTARSDNTVLTNPQMEEIVGFARQKARQTYEQIAAGNIRAFPSCIGNKNICEYCDYKSVCGFDEQVSQQNVIKKVTKRDFFAAMEDAHGVDG